MKNHFEAKILNNIQKLQASIINIICIVFKKQL